MADLSDNDLRAELKRLSGKDVGPVTASTRPSMVKKLIRLRETKDSTDSAPGVAHKEKPKAKSGGRAALADTSVPLLSPKLTTKGRTKSSNVRARPFGFSSDEEANDGTSASGDSTKSKRQMTATERSTTSTLKAKVSSKNSLAATQYSNGHGGLKIPTEDELKCLSSDEIQAKLFELTGERFPITDATKPLHIKKLRKILGSADASVSSSVLTDAVAMDVTIPSPNEAQFSDSDEEIMDFEPSPVVSTNGNSLIDSKGPRKPHFVSQAVNTSSFLDITVPESSMDAPDSDCIVQPAPDSYNDGEDDDIQVCSNSPNFAEMPSRLPSPNLSSTRRSFVPSSAILKPGPSSRVIPKPMPPSPPRSAYARRPLRDLTKFTPLNTESSTKPVNRFSSIKTASLDSQFTKPNYTTRYTTGERRAPGEPSAKKAKVVKDVDMMIRDKGRSVSYLYSRALVIGLAIFVAVLLMFYFYLRVTAPAPLDKVFDIDDTYWSLVERQEGDLAGECTPSEEKTCYPADKLRDAKSVVDSLRGYLAQHAGRFECNWPENKERRVAQAVARNHMQEVHGDDVYHLWDAVLNLIIHNPHWDIKSFGRTGNLPKLAKDIWWLESKEAVKPWSCALANTMTRMLTVIVAVFTVAVLGYLAFLYGSYRKRHRQQQEELFYDLLENTMDLLEAQFMLSKDKPEEKPYLAISHVHDTLITPPDRRSMKGIWSRVVKHIKDNESRVREELQQVQGEEYLVWRWVQSADAMASPGGTHSRWLGSALKDATKYKLNFTPKYCLKIRGMFDINRETGTNWPLRIQDDILEKLGPDHGVVHIAVDTESEENRVYAKLASRKHAGKAFQLLNGSYYGATGECVQCKFLESNKYHQKFPHAEFATAHLKKSSEVNLPTRKLYPSLPQTKRW